jgi:hypothetical protein
MQAARDDLETLKTELAFEQISVRISDNDLHWQFFYGGKHIADFWPASGKGQIVGELNSVSCGSVAQAQKLAVCAKRRLFGEIAKKMQQPYAAEEESPEAPPG